MKTEIKIEDIEVFTWLVLYDNGVSIDFRHLNVYYFKDIVPEMVAQCARLNLWTTKYDIEGEDYQISLDGFMESDFGVEHAIELSIFYLKENGTSAN